MGKWVVVLLVFVSITSTVMGHMFAPTHTCSKPFAPYRFDSQWQYDNYIADVNRYRRCIETFVDEQNAAADRHLQAANNAIDEWNRFVRLELY